MTWLKIFLKNKHQESSSNNKDLTNGKTIDTISISPLRSIQIIEAKNNKIYIVEKENENTKFIKEVKDPNILTYIKNKKNGKLTDNNFLSEYIKKIVPNITKSEKISSNKIDYIIDDENITKLDKYTKKEYNPPKPKIEPIAPVGLIAKLEKAIDRFAENNPDDDLVTLGKRNKIEIKDYKKDYKKDKITELNSYKESSYKKLEVNNLSKEPVFSNKSFSTFNSELINKSSLEPVSQSLNQVIERQKEKLKEIRAKREQNERERQRINQLLDRKEEIEHKVDQIQQMLTQIEKQSDRIQNVMESSLQATSEELIHLEEELSKILTDAGILRLVIEEKEDLPEYSRDNILNSIINSLRKIHKQKKQISSIRYAKEQAEIEERRVAVLLIRLRELENNIKEIRSVINQIEEANREIDLLDPNAVIEPVPPVVFNELKRYEFELNSILADPGVSRKLSEMNEEELLQNNKYW